MLGKVFRDLPVVPALQQVMSGLWSSYVDALSVALMRGWTLTGARRKRLKAALELVIDFGSWETLTRGGLTPKAAASLAARMVTAGLELAPAPARQSARDDATARDRVGPSSAGASR